MMSGIYVHIPFCISKCRYCDFVSGPYDEEIRKQYFFALKNEIREYFSERSIQADTVFFGGGTPSCADAEYISGIMDDICCMADIMPGAESTIEINPGTLTREKFSVYKGCGFNRFSVGLQSDDDTMLKRLGRIHSKKQFEQTLDILAGENINTDIIYSLPGQSVDQAVKTAEYVGSLPVSHVSAYALMPEKGTPLYEDIQSGIISCPDDEADRKMYYGIRNVLGSAGFGQYEISNFAKPGCICRHNMKYWTGDDYIGFGVAAHSKTGNTRFMNTSEISEYIKNNGICRSVEEQLLPEDEEYEFIMLRLRLTEGFALSEFRSRFGCGFTEKYSEELEPLEKSGCIDISAGRVKLTEKGLDIQNYVLTELMK